jgi:hypothetical protein
VTDGSRHEARTRTFMRAVSAVMASTPPATLADDYGGVGPSEGDAGLLLLLGGGATLVASRRKHGPGLAKGRFQRFGFSLSRIASTVSIDSLPT